VRVIAGSAKGTRLAPVPAGTRPMSDRAREGLFSSLGPAVAGAAVLDLYAGTGAEGIEAMSRGARSAVFVDSAPAAARTIRENLRRTRLAQGAAVRRQDVRSALRSNLGQFDLVLLDPPYRAEPAELDAVLAELAGQGVLAPGGLVALTRSKESYTPVIPVNWLVERQLTYGDAVVLVLRA
jgi:16S rRNA (guanine966-N2)-methyltransferase